MSAFASRVSRPAGDASGRAWGTVVIDDDLVRMSAFVVKPGAHGHAPRPRTFSLCQHTHSPPKPVALLTTLFADGAQGSAKRPREDETDGAAGRAAKAPRPPEGSAADHAAATAGTSAADAAGDEAEWAAEAAAANTAAGPAQGGSAGVRQDLEVSAQESVLYLGELRDIPGARSSDPPRPQHTTAAIPPASSHSSKRRASHASQLR